MANLLAQEYKISCQKDAMQILQSLRRRDWLLIDAEEEEEADDEEEGDELETEDEEVETPVDLHLQLLEQSRQGQIVLSSEDYNNLLLSLSIDPLRPTDEILQDLLQTHSAMTETNARTYEVLLLALIRRLDANGIAIELIQRYLLPTPALWTGQSYRLAWEVADERLAKPLFDVARQRTTGFAIPVFVYGAYLGFVTDVAEALDVVRLSLRKNRRRNMDDLLQTAIRWSSDTAYLSALLDELFQVHPHTPSFSVWKDFVYTAQRGDQVERWELVRDVLLALPRLGHMPNQGLVRMGLRAAEGLEDPALAVDLILQPLAKASRFPDVRIDPLEPEPTGIPNWNDALRALDLCLRHGDFDSAGELVDRLVVFAPNHVQHDMCHALLRGQSATGDREACDRTVEKMRERGLDLDERSQGLLVSVCLSSGDRDAAFAIVEDHPSPSTFEALMLGVDAEEALRLYDEMKANDIKPTAATLECLLKTSLVHDLDAVRELVESSAEWTQANAMLALNVLVPSEEGTLDSVRHVLRERNEIDLVRRLREAELEEKDGLWRGVLLDVAKL